MPIKSIKIESLMPRIIVALVILICLASAYFFAKWGFANTISTRTQYREVADFTTQLAPSDPQTHYASAVLHEKSFLPEDFQKSLIEFEKAAALSPHNYHLWLALGKARERSGDADGAEKALRKAAELAPNYAQVQWTLGNVLLRRGKTAEAFTEIRKAVISDAKYTDPAVSAAWQVSGGDLAQIKQAVGDSAQIKSALAIFLAKQKRFDEAFEIWNSLSADAKKKAFKTNGEEFYKQLIAEKKFRLAVAVLAQISSDDPQAFTVGKINNSDFESDIKTQDAGIFEWKIDSGAQPQIALNDQTKHGGKRSLWMIFNSSDGKGFRAISQTVAVEPGKNYEFETFYKSELKTSSTVRWEIADAADGKILASTEAISANADWTALRTKFSVSAPTEAVSIRLARANCSSQICPISGKVWFDDFSLR